VDNLVPPEFYLSQNYPNPFSERTTIKLCVADKARVTLEVFDSGGRTVEILLDEEKEAGTYGVEFSSSVDHRGERRNLSEGVYVYQLRWGASVLRKRMHLLRHA
jgi:hypothetical protein